MDDRLYEKAFEEEVNILRLKTGLLGWREYILSLVEEGKCLKRCPQCMGDGRRSVRTLGGMSIDGGVCPECDGNGTAVVQKDASK